MKTIYYTLIIVILISITGIKIRAQEKTYYWSIGHYIKPVPVTQPIQKLGIKSVQSGGNISTNNIIYNSSNSQSELSAAIDKNNSKHIMVGANIFQQSNFLGQGWYATTDGGFNWY